MGNYWKMEKSTLEVLEDYLLLNNAIRKYGVR